MLRNKFPESFAAIYELLELVNKGIRAVRHEDSEKYRTIPRLETLLEPVKEFLSLPDNNFTVNLTAAKMRLAQSSDAYSGCYA